MPGKYEQGNALNVLASFAEREEPGAARAERVAAAKELLQELGELDGRSGITVQHLDDRSVLVTAASRTVKVWHNSTAGFGVQRQDEAAPLGAPEAIQLQYNYATGKFEGDHVGKDGTEARRDGLVEVTSTIVRHLGTKIGG